MWPKIIKKLLFKKKVVTLLKISGWKTRRKRISLLFLIRFFTQKYKMFLQTIDLFLLEGAP